jgi:succinate-acetate transporter protein
MSPSNPNPAHPDYNPETGMKHNEGLRRRTEGTPAQHHDFLLAKEIKALKCHIHPPVPNPAPLGLIAFGLTTALLQMKHTRIAGDSEDDLNGVDTVVLGFAMFFGGLLQVIAGLGEVRRNNIFGYTAFLIFGT